VTALLRGDQTKTGVRSFDPYRDLRPVTELIAIAFKDKLGPDGQIALAEMRRIARWGPLLWWLFWPGWSGGGVAPGFVWVEQGRVVGNVSLRRALGWGGFFIGNLAVHPDWRGRGIATALMRAALEAISERGGLWVALEVRADNEIARRLYDGLGFQDVGRTLHMLRPAGLPWTGSLPSSSSLRRGRNRDSAALIRLVRAVVSEPQRPLLELRKREDYRPGWERTLNCWLEGRREVWWVVEDGGTVRGAVRVLHERGSRPDRLELLVEPDQSGRFEATLLQRGLASLGGAPKKMVETVLPSTPEPLVAALEKAGFQRLRELVQMRLDLGYHVPVKG
jgi:GNAT superfamily N-acetyltransferase